MRHIVAVIVFGSLLIGCENSGNEEEGGEIMAYSEETEMEPSTEENNELIEQENPEEIETIHVLHCNIGLYQEPAVMVLNWGQPDENRTSTIKGYYYYVRHQKKLDVDGYSDSRTRGIYLEESYKGKSSGYMEFYQDDIDNASYWSTSKESSDHQDFNSEDLFFQDSEDDAVTLQMEKLVFPHGIQVYNGETWDEGETEDELNYIIINEAYFAFDVHVTRTNGHTGSINGFTEMTPGADEIIWKDTEGCALTFDLSTKDKITIVEDNCDYYHGARAQFDGTYTK